VRFETGAALMVGSDELKPGGVVEGQMDGVADVQSSFFDEKSIESHHAS
jgi:hypothetical protein